MSVAAAAMAAATSVVVAEAEVEETEDLTGVVVVVDPQVVVVTVMGVTGRRVVGEDVLVTGGVLFPTVATTTLPGVTAATAVTNRSLPALMTTATVEVVVVSAEASVAEGTVGASGDVVGTVGVEGA